MIDRCHFSWNLFLQKQLKGTSQWCWSALWDLLLNVAGKRLEPCFANTSFIVFLSQSDDNKLNIIQQQSVG